MIKNSQETNNIEEFLYLEKEHFINKKKQNFQLVLYIIMRNYVIMRKYP